MSRVSIAFTLLVFGSLVSVLHGSADGPALTGIAPTILDAFGISPPGAMTGRSIFQHRHAPKES